MAGALRRRDDDVAPVGKHGYLPPLSSGKNFWMVSEHHAAERRRGFFQVSRFWACTGSCGAIHGSGKKCRKAVVEVVAVGEHNERGFSISGSTTSRRRKIHRQRLPDPACARRRRHAGRVRQRAVSWQIAAAVLFQFHRPALAARMVRQWR